MDTSEANVESALGLIARELDQVVERLVHDDPDGLNAFAEAIAQAPRVFVLGAGRSGLALRMTAMRFMHLGLDVHIVGEVTTPAIEADDLLVTASGSGTTSVIVRAAQTAISVGAKVAAVTTAPASPLAELATVTILVPAAGKLDRSGTASAQFAGSLFEQTVVLLGDALFHALWQRSGATADELWPRHANLE